MGILFLFANRISIIASAGVVINSANELLVVARKQLDGMLFGSKRSIACTPIK